MTGAEWLACMDAEKLLRAVEDCASERKLRLLSAALCQSIRHLLTDKRSRQAVRLARLSVDGWATPEACTIAREEAAQVPYWRPTAAEFAANAARLTLRDMSVSNVVGIFGLTEAAISAEVTERAGGKKNPILTEQLGKEAARKARENERVAIQLIRDVFGNPFDPVSFDPRWRTLNVLAIAEGTYAGPAFDRMPILADALEDVGCTNAGLLAHCRQGGEHIRGCWVVDLVLAKE
jgi:hypothetical protein